VSGTDLHLRDETRRLLDLSDRLSLRLRAQLSDLP
jgi:hypothetical protein